MKYIQKILDEVRAELACNFLRETDLSIAEIGERIGIQDIAKFQRAFRRRTGVTPRKWRAK